MTVTHQTAIGLLLVAALLVAACGSDGVETIDASDLQDWTAATDCPPPRESDPATTMRFTNVASELGIGGSSAPLNVDEVTYTLSERITWGAGASVVDINNDGWDDLYVPRHGAPNALFVNDCGTSFTDEAVERGLALDGDHLGSAFADIDDDGDVDAIVLGVNDTLNAIYLNDGLGRFDPGATIGSAAVPNRSMDVLPVDIEGDGDIDLFVSRWFGIAQEQASAPSELLLNDGEGNFTAAEEFVFDRVAAFMAQATDFDGDGLLDLSVSGDYGTSSLFLQDENGWFTDITVEARLGGDESGMGSVVHDFNRDGLQDWFVTSIYHDGLCTSGSYGCTGNRLYLNNGDRTFRDATDEFGLRDAGWAWGAGVGDFDNDGDMDLAVTNGWESSRIRGFATDEVRFWLNTGSEPWVESASQFGLGGDTLGKAVVPWDYDRDGDLDIAIARTGQEMMVFRNDTPRTSGDFLVVSAVKNETPLVGAEVVVEAGGVQHRSTIGIGNTLSGSEPGWVHFGLGDVDGDVTVTISHPVHGTREVRGVQPNGYVKVPF